ncbi:MAG: argininosuccinate lyase [Firmicutes bacterium]|nr:argininosuccinate lyase [Bacillota bacterium]
MKNKKSKKIDTSGFTVSLSFDRRLAPYDIAGSIAHCKMLVKCKIVSKSEGENILKGLREIKEEIIKGKFKFFPQDEDIHMAIERRLIEKTGESGGRLHTARSRNDQVSLDMRMYLRNEIKKVSALIKNLQDSIVKLSEKNMEVIMPGFTHLQHAQPVLFSHHLMAYFFMLKRDRERFADCLNRVNVLPLGAGALAGTSFSIDREFIARQLGFSSVSENSIDTVSDRDFVIEFLSTGAMLMMHLSRLAEELVIWSSSEFSFIEMDEDFCTGSSIMPQKKNPDVAELIRGKTGRIYGNLQSLLTIMKGLPLSYNRDMQEDKESLFDTVDTLKNVLEVLSPLISSLKLNRERMFSLAKEGYANATDAADYLVRKGVPFRKAHQLIRDIVLYSMGRGKSLEELSVKELKVFSPLFSEDFFDVINIKKCVESRKSQGGTAPEKVKNQIKKSKVKEK